MKIYWYNSRLFLQVTPTKEYTLTHCWCFSMPSFSKDTHFISFQNVCVTTYWLNLWILSIRLKVIERNLNQ